MNAKRLLAHNLYSLTSAYQDWHCIHSCCCGARCALVPVSIRMEHMCFSVFQAIGARPCMCIVLLVSQEHIMVVLHKQLYSRWQDESLAVCMACH